jgi:hypothetical protein
MHGHNKQLGGKLINLAIIRAVTYCITMYVNEDEFMHYHTITILLQQSHLLITKILSLACKSTNITTSIFYNSDFVQSVEKMIYKICVMYTSQT